MGIRTESQYVDKRIIALLCIWGYEKRTGLHKGAPNPHYYSVQQFLMEPSGGDVIDRKEIEKIYKVVSQAWMLQQDSHQIALDINYATIKPKDEKMSLFSQMTGLSKDYFRKARVRGEMSIQAILLDWEAREKLLGHLLTLSRESGKIRQASISD